MAPASPPTQRPQYNTARFPGGIITNSAISGIEHALWDIAAKSAGVPVWALLGGRVRNKIRVYQSISGDTPEQAAEKRQGAGRHLRLYGDQDGDLRVGRH